jgi:hypothetical protein
MANQQLLVPSSFQSSLETLPVFVPGNKNTFGGKWIRRFW